MNILRSLVLVCCVIAAYSADSPPATHKDIAPAPVQLPEHLEPPRPAAADDNVHPKPHPKSSTLPPTTHEPTPSSPKTSSSPAPTTTPKSTTTPSVTPKTSTAPPITHPTTPKTTVTPPTTTKAPPTPAPAPKPEVGNWSVGYPDSNKSCIVMMAEIQLELVWTEKNKTMNQTWVVPKNAEATGACGNETQWILLQWGQNKTSQLHLDFVKTKDKKFEVQNVTASINVTLPDQGPNVWNFSLVNQTDFPTPLQMSYKCMKEQTLKLKADKTNSTFVNLKLSHVQMQAFMNSTSDKFDSALDCEGSVVNDTVPIVVGSILIVMILMILAAYLLSRRRCQARGYLSM
ncbi:unnamed protein product [Acanthoscelides obtectus]|nr:unnamed protein product [Acanthoscelides obtectus]CAK1629627.1 Lysosome-associated membrane glycoprotein 1 [Acanthoscelides obtectus]